MIRKLKRISVLPVVVGAVLLALVIIGFWLARLSGVQRSFSPEANKSSQPAGSMQASVYEVQKQNVNGIEVTASNFRLEENLVKVDVCFQVPDKSEWSDWSIFATTLDYGSGKVSDFWEGVIEGRSMPDSATWQQCDWIGFQVPADVSLSSLTLTIEIIGALPVEGHQCEEWRAMLNKEEDAASLGIEAECKQVDGGAQFTIINKPAAMSEDELNLIISKSRMVMGPWIFTSDLEN